MEDKYYLIDAMLVHQIINTLKDLKVKGFESKKDLVLCVVALENVVENGAINLEKEGKEVNDEPCVDEVCDSEED